MIAYILTWFKTNPWLYKDRPLEHVLSTHGALGSIPEGKKEAKFVLLDSWNLIYF